MTVHVTHAIVRYVGGDGDGWVSISTLIDGLTSLIRARDQSGGLRAQELRAWRRRRGSEHPSWPTCGGSHSMDVQRADLSPGSAPRRWCDTSGVQKIPGGGVSRRELRPFHSLMQASFFNFRRPFGTSSEFFFCQLLYIL